MPIGISRNYFLPSLEIHVSPQNRNESAFEESSRKKRTLSLKSLFLGSQGHKRNAL